MKTMHILLTLLTFLTLSACTTTYQQPFPTEGSTAYSSSNSNTYTNSNQTYSNNNDTSWFSGGTLHNSTVREWRNASYANRLATSADFVAATQNVDYGNLTQFKKWATNLEACISTAASGGDADDEQVSFIGSLCMTQLFPN
jgi:hypothetical protein